MIDAARGREIARRREAIGLRCGRLAELAQISPFVLSRIEHGARAVRPEEYRRLAAVLAAFERAIADVRRLAA